MLDGLSPTSQDTEGTPGDLGGHCGDAGGHRGALGGHKGDTGRTLGRDTGGHWADTGGTPGGHQGGTGVMLGATRGILGEPRGDTGGHGGCQGDTRGDPGGTPGGTWDTRDTGGHWRALGDTGGTPGTPGGTRVHWGDTRGTLGGHTGDTGDRQGTLGEHRATANSGRQTESSLLLPQSQSHHRDPGRPIPHLGQSHTSSLNGGPRSQLIPRDQASDTWPPRRVLGHRLTTSAGLPSDFDCRTTHARHTGGTFLQGESQTGLQNLAGQLATPTAPRSAGGVSNPTTAALLYPGAANHAPVDQRAAALV